MVYNAQNGISIETLNNEINRLYNDADMLFGNIDYHDLNADLAARLNRWEKTFIKGKNDGGGGGGTVETTTYDIVRGTVHPWKSIDQTWTGAAYEMAYQDIRVVIGHLLKAGEVPATRCARVKFPLGPTGNMSFDTDPVIFYSPIMFPWPRMTEWIPNRHTGDLFKGVELNVMAYPPQGGFGQDEFVIEERIREAPIRRLESGLYEYTTEQVPNFRREILIMAVGISNAEVKSYKRPDYRA